MNLQKPFKDWYSKHAPQSYKNWNWPRKLNEIVAAYHASFGNNFFEVDTTKIFQAAQTIQDNLDRRYYVKDKTFADFDKRASNGIPKAIIGSFIKFLQNYQPDIISEPTEEKPEILTLESTEINADFDEVVSLWKNYNKAVNLLQEKMGSTRNIVGEFAELLVAKFCNAQRFPVSEKGADLLTSDGLRIQVKSRTAVGGSLGIIRSWDFDRLAVVLFNAQGNIEKAIIVNASDAQRFATKNNYQGGFVIAANNNFLNGVHARDITLMLQAILDK